MTAILGIKAKDAVVLASDQLITNIDASGKPIKYLRNQKLRVSKNNAYAFGFAGYRQEHSIALEEDLVTCNPIEVIKELQEGLSHRVRQANISAILDNNKYPETKHIVNFIFGTRLAYENDTVIEKPKLYHVYHLGEVEERKHPPYVSIGSGQDYVAQLLNIEIGNLEVDLDKAVILAFKALKRAITTDPGSEGMNMMIITKKNIYDHFNMILTEFDNAEKRILKNLQRRYK